jgi:hypothetical protein
MHTMHKKESDRKRESLLGWSGMRSCSEKSCTASLANPLPNKFLSVFSASPVRLAPPCETSVVLHLCGQLSGICANLRNLRFPPLLGHPCLSVFIRGSFPFSVSWRSWRFNSIPLCAFCVANFYPLSWRFNPGSSAALWLKIYWN